MASSPDLITFQFLPSNNIEGLGFNTHILCVRGIWSIAVTLSLALIMVFFPKWILKVHPSLKNLMKHVFRNSSFIKGVKVKDHSVK